MIMGVMEVNLVSSVACVFAVVILFLLYISSPNELSVEEKERFEKDTENLFPTYKEIYRTIGGLAYWITAKLTFFERIKPNVISLLGFLVNFLGSVLIPLFLIGPAGILFLVGGLLDIIDGKVARTKRHAKPHGALVDSFLDRISEIAMFGGIMVFFSIRENNMFSIITAGAMAFSLLVSYVRAKGEALGIMTREGIMRRQERIIMISLSLILDSLFSYFTQKIIFTNIGIFLVLIGAVITSLERFRNIFLALKKAGK